MRSNPEFRERLFAVLEKAVMDLLAELGEERLYAFSLYTSGEEDFAYVCASANTEEGLRAASRTYAEKDPAYAGEAGLKKLRWSVPLDIIERFGFGKIFNEKGTADYNKYGAFTKEDKLATSAAFLIAKCRDITEAQIRRMQAILGRRVEADRNLRLTSTLAENMARVLHQLRPKRFPAPQLNPKTNHLDNPEPFLPAS